MVAFEYDTQDPDDMERMAEEAIENLDKLDIWVNDIEIYSAQSIFEVADQLLDEVTAIKDSSMARQRYAIKAVLF